jgi:2-dehydro-3-deoxygluconokinase
MDVITFGESMVIFNPEAAGPLRHVNNFTKALGGAESNLAIALARLGHKVGWFSKLGSDEFGRFVINAIRAEGIDVSRVSFDCERSTGLLFKERYQNPNANVYYYRKNSAASSLNVSDLDEEYIKSAKILHITGITPALSRSACEAVFQAVNIAKQHGVKVSFDPNIRLKLWSIEEAAPVILKLAKEADILMPGVDEAELLLGIKDPDEISNYFINEGCSLVAVKLGKEGCYLKNREKGVFIPGYKVDRVEDTVGAGDGFAAGLLSGLLKNSSLEECGEYANGVGAMATLVKGDMEGYPCFEQLMQFIGKRQRVER